MDEKGRDLYPLPFPKIVVEAGVFRPTQGSFLLWKHLFRSGVGEGKRCLDVGCGTGILAVQLALNGAQHAKGKELHLCPLQFDIVDRVIPQSTEPRPGARTR